MRRSIMKTLKSGISVLLIFALLFVPMTGLQIQAAENTSAFAVTDEELNAAREQFFGTSEIAPFSAFDLSEPEREVIHINDSNIIHKPQEFITPESPSLITPYANYTSPYAGPFIVGDTRPFYTDSAKNDGTWLGIKGKLVAQSKHCNIWVFDDADFHAKTGTSHSGTCHLTDINQIIGNQIAARFDPIYEAMTDSNTGFAAHANFQAQVGYSNLPTIGDMGNDGKVNFLLYDFYSTTFYSGYFWSGDFFTNNSSGQTFNALDMLHIDISDGYGYKVLTSVNEEDKLDFYGTMAHEFQHLLYYIYYRAYTPSEYASDSWINETLSELAKAFYTDKTKELVNYGRLVSAAQNEYDSKSKNEYTDFFNHIGLKNYGMERFFAHMLYKKYTNIAKNIYSYIKTTYPPAQNSTQRTANTGKIKSMPQAVGDFLRAGTNNTIGSGGENTVSLLYYLFMENFAADGGNIISGNNTVKTTKFYPAATNPVRPMDNLWAFRYAAGRTNGLIYETLGGRVYYGENYTGLPSISSGGKSTILLKGYGTVNPKSPSHEMLYRLNEGQTGETILNITAPNDGNNETRYYVAVPNDDLYVTPYIYTSGLNGASVYPLTKGVPKIIYTKGKEAYLFVVTLYKNVSSQITYSWSAPVNAATPVISVQPKDFRKTKSETTSCTLSVTAKSTDGGMLSYQWYSSASNDNTNGNPISGATGSSYTPPMNKIGTTYYYAVVTNQINDNGDGGAKTASTASVPAEITIITDLDRNGEMDILDLVLLAQHIAEISSITENNLIIEADINNDSKINILDLILLSQLLTR